MPSPHVRVVKRRKRQKDNIWSLEAPPHTARHWPAPALLSVIDANSTGFFYSRQGTTVERRGRYASFHLSSGYLSVVGLTE